MYDTGEFHNATANKVLQEKGITNTSSDSLRFFMILHITESVIQYYNVNTDKSNIVMNFIGNIITVLP